MGRVSVLFIVALAIWLALIAPAPASYPGGNGKLAMPGTYSGRTEIFTVEPDGTALTRLTTGEQYYSGGYRYRYSTEPSWSPDGRRIAFSSNRSGDEEIWIMDADGGNPVRVTHDPDADGEPSWSPDGSHLAFTRGTDLWTIAIDGSGEKQITSGPDYDHQAKWSPKGGKIAFIRRPSFGSSAVYVVGPDGTALTRLTGEHDAVDPDWSPDGLLISYRDSERGLLTMQPDGADQQLLPGTKWATFPVWAPEGDRFAAIDNGELITFSENGFAERTVVVPQGQSVGPPSWQPTQPPPQIPGYPRPRGASPLIVSLVPAYSPCEQPNAEHGAPLAFASCAPPFAESAFLTAGTPDANGGPARFAGSVRFSVMRGDVRLRARLTGVLCAVEIPGSCVDGALSAYTGELQGAFALRLTDWLNGHARDRPGTLDVFQYAFNLPCAAGEDPVDGGVCGLHTTFNALVPNVVREGLRAVWQIGAVEIRDGGADGNASSDDYGVLARQGVYVP